ncbi:MAG: hypothetical protein NTW14_09470 [bacterium]|nr:hypothetical protein [bacterium]
MIKRFDSPAALFGAVLCLSCGLLLWYNLALHFAQFEEVLPSLSSAELLQGKGFFVALIAAALLYAIIVGISLPWASLKAENGGWLKKTASAVLFGFSFLPIFWLRFGAPAWTVLIFLLAAFLLNLVGILLLSAFLARRVSLPPLKVTVPGVLTRPWVPALLLVGSAVYFIYHCFNFTPHIEDSIAQLLQGRIFASGRAWVEPFRPQEFFYFSYMLDADRWFSMYPPGHSLLLALGVLFRVPYLINPLLGGLSVILFFHLIKTTDGKKSARWGSWALALSPFLIFMSSEYMNHLTALAASLLGWFALAKATDGKTRWIGLAGLAFGYCTATRPLEGVIFAALGMIFIASGGFDARWKKLASYGIAFLLGISPFLIFNQITTGNLFMTGYKLIWGVSGFGLGQVGWGEAHTVGYGLINTSMSWSGLNFYLWEIPIPALLGVFIWGFWGDKITRWDRLFLASMLAIPAAYFFFYAHDFCFGPRYYHIILPQLVYFSVKGIGVLYRQLTEKLNLEAALVKRSLIWAGVLLLLLQVAVAMPFRTSVYADSYWGTDDAPYRAAKRLKLNHAVIFIENHPWSVLQTKLHSLGFKLGDTQRLIFVITEAGLDQVLREMGYDPDQVWGISLDRADLEKRMQAWNQAWLIAGNPPVDPWTEKGTYTYFSNAALHLDPRDRDPDLILAQDLGAHNLKLLEKYPSRKAYRYAFDEEAGRFKLLPWERAK